MSLEVAYDNLLAQLKAVQAECDELVAHVERLREALEKLRASVDCGEARSFDRNYITATALTGADSALAATPAQSLARLRDEVLEEAAGVAEEHGAYLSAAAIRAMKESE